MLIDGLISLLQGAPNPTGPAGVAELQAALVAFTGVRIYENELPRGYTLPAIAVHQYGGVRDYDYTGPVDIKEDQIQLDCYGADSPTCRATKEAATKLLESYVGTLPDGTVVQGLFYEREQAMPFVKQADQKGIANRWMVGFRVVKQS